MPLPCHPPIDAQCARSALLHLACQVPNWWVQPPAGFCRCVVDYAALSQLHEHLRQRDTELTRACLRHLLPWLWFLGTTVQWGCGCCCHSFAVQCGTIAPPSERAMAAMSAMRHALGPGSAASTTPWPCASPVSLVGAKVSLQLDRCTLHLVPRNLVLQKFRCSLIAAHCILFRAISCSSISTATSECSSAPVCKFLSTHLSQLMPLACQRSRLSLRLCPGVNQSFIVRMSVAISPHQQRGTQPSCSKLSLEGL